MQALEKKFLLRWKFDYSDTKPSRKGMWDKSGDNPIDQAWSQSKENLLYARIEGKNIITRETKVLAEVPGYDFCNFEWFATAASSQAIAALKAGQLKTQIQGTNIGLIIVTRNKRIYVMCNGIINEEIRQDKNFNFASFGK